MDDDRTEGMALDGLLHPSDYTTLVKLRVPAPKITLEVSPRHSTRICTRYTIVEADPGAGRGRDTNRLTCRWVGKTRLSC